MFELSKPQKSIYNMEKFAGDSVAVICSSMLRTGDIAAAILQNAVNELFRMNYALRIKISETTDGVRQSVSEYIEREFEVLKFGSHAEFTEYAKSFAKQPIDVYGCLCDVKIIFAGNKYGLLVKLHHIIGDAWTMSLLGKQFTAVLNGDMPEAYSYYDYIQAENEYIQGKRYMKDKQFFIEQFKKCDEVTYLSDKQDKGYNAGRKTVTLNYEITKQIQEVAEANNSGIFSVFMTLLAIYFSRIKMNEEKLYIGTPVLNRTGIKEQNTVGMFINTVPMLAEINYDGTFIENLQSATDTIMSILRHQRYNYEDLLSELRGAYGFTEKLYDVILSYQNAKTEAEGFETEWYHCGMQTESLQIHIDDRENSGTLTINYDYREDKFTEKEIERMHEHMFNLLADAIAHSDRKVYELEMLSDNEKHRLLYEFNDTKADYPKDKCVHQLFEEQVLKTPDETAVIACDKTLTYDELNKLSNRIANALIERGIGVGDIVAFALPRTSCLIAVMFGILKSGAAYMPVDPDYPQDRKQYLLDESNARPCITSNIFDELMNNNNEANPQVAVNQNDIYCALHTSGSTGIPKLSLLTHKGIISFAEANKAFFDGVDASVSATIITFDAFIMESVISLINGIKVRLASDDEIYNQHKFENIFNDYSNVMFFSTPTKMKTYIESSSTKKFLNRISSFVIGGEIFTSELYKLITDNAERGIIYNIYGPTETTICTAVEKVESTDITIGKPRGNIQIYILDKYNNIKPIGQVGELCIAGDGVGAGYLNRPELTAEKFVDNPFGEGKMYKTGDLAYWREDGNIMFVGRNDFQVKIRGLRIELGEVENAICAVDGVSQAVVVVRKDDSGRQLICAFYTEKAGVVIADIKKVISDRLPKYMMPHIFTHLDEMPLTPSGKINRKALPEVDLESINSDAEYVKPQTELQRSLTDIMETVLGISPIGLNDDFFDIGGDSLKGIEFVSKAHNEGIYFNLQAIFDNPTVAKLCEYIKIGDRHHATYQLSDFDRYNDILSKNVMNNSFVPPVHHDIGDVFVTGATGFLGSHIIDAFMSNSNGRIYCLVRENEKRLFDTLKFYFGDKYADNDRIIPLIGDLETVKELSIDDSIDFVIHTAASVKHYGSYRYFYDMNVAGTQNIIDFTKRHNAKLLHISTLSVSGNAVADATDAFYSGEEMFFDETSFFIGQPLDNE